MLRLIPRTTQAPEWPRPADISPMMHRLLRLRGVRSEEEARAFLSPSRQQLRDPFLLSDMRQAVDVIQASVENGESICVYGDYDVDGVCASAIVVSYLKSIGAKAEPYLPSRHQEGYGLNENALKEIAKKHSLLVTVDCGITAVSLVECAKREGLKVVVTDHHRPEGELPACPVVNPLLNDYPFPYLCGAGVAFQLVSALGGREKGMEYIDYAALATIADIVPLYDENRAIASIGLKKINASARPGIRALIEAAGLSSKPLTAGNVAFQLTPRLNASGRIGDAMRAYNLITSTDMDECIRLASELNEENAHRKTLEQAAIDEAEQMLSDFDFPNHRIIIVMGENWNPGVIGLAASRLTEKYHYPTCVLTKEDDVYVGSCRSIEGIDIHDALTSVSDLLVKFGGHKMAAGLTVKAENAALLQDALDMYLFQTAPMDAYIPYVEYDMSVEADMLTPESVHALNALSPTGCGNPAPVFRMGAEIPSARPVGANGLHLKLSLKTETGNMDGIWFRKGELASSLPRKAEIIFQPAVSEYQGRVSVQAEIRQIAPAGPRDCLAKAYTSGTTLFEDFLENAASKLPLSEKSLSVTCEEMADIMRSATQGVMVVCATAEGAKNVLAVCMPHESMPVDITVGEYPKDKRAFRTIAISPAGEIPKEYHTIITADIPEGLVKADYNAADFQIAEPFSSLPDIDELRTLYATARRIIKRPYYFVSRRAVIKSLAEEANITEIAACAGCLVLEHMSLLFIREKENACYIEIPEMVKKSPEDDELFQSFAAWRSMSRKGGLSHE